VHCYVERYKITVSGRHSQRPSLYSKCLCERSPY